MKRYLLTLTLLLSALSATRADVVWNEGFNYADGALTNVAPGIWTSHSGATVDALVAGKKLQVGINRQMDVNRLLSSVATNALTSVSAGFTISCTNLPSGTNYFAHFRQGNTFNGRLWAAQGSLPGTWKIGVTTLSGTLSLIKFFPVDLSTNVDYQVVVNWDETLGVNSIATLWVNPLTGSDTPVVASDAAAGVISESFAFRQQGSGGPANFLLTNLVVATTFDEAATNVWATTPVTPVIAVGPKGGTNFTGNPLLLTAIAAGQNLGNLTYTWLKNGAIFTNPNGNTNTLYFPSIVEADSGAYRFVATTSLGLSATSAVANLWITNPPVPPTITVHPSNTTVYFGQTATLTVAATGPGTITYQWNHFGTNLPGENGTTLNIPNVQAGNGTTGNYNCGVTNEYGGVLSATAVVSGQTVPSASVAFLRTLVDGVNYNATNSTQVWQATGTVSTFTNLTTGNTASYYLQDGTAGINIFATFASTFRPAQGDYVRFVGVLSSFNSTLELLADTVVNPVASYTIISNGAALPAPKPIAFGITNNLALCEALEGSIVMLTNVYFGTNEGATIVAGANTTITVTNAAGETFLLFFSSQDADTVGQVLPGFARSVIGPFTQNHGNAVLPRNQGYSVTVTRFADIVTAEPPAPVLVQTHVGDKSTLTWTNVAWDNVNAAYGSNYSYTLLASTNVAGPYAPVQRYQAVLLGVNEVGPNSSPAIGFGTVGVSADQTKITVNLTFSGLVANATASHIHGPALPGANAGVIFGFSGVPAAPGGSIPEQTFSITPTQLGYLTSGQLYFNVHTTTYGGGEIRGQIYLVPAAGLTSPNSSFLNTTPTTSSYLDPNAGGSQKYYQLTSP